MAYPASLDNLATNKTNPMFQVDDHAEHHNAMATAINAVEAELGLDPSGDDSTVRARLDGIQDTSDVYTITNPSARRTINVTDYSMDELASLLGTLIADLQDRKIIG